MRSLLHNTASPGTARHGNANIGPGLTTQHAVCWWSAGSLAVMLHRVTPARLPVRPSVALPIPYAEWTAWRL